MGNSGLLRGPTRSSNKAAGIHTLPGGAAIVWSVGARPQQLEILSLGTPAARGQERHPDHSDRICTDLRSFAVVRKRCSCAIRTSSRSRWSAARTLNGGGVQLSQPPLRTLVLSQRGYIRYPPRQLRPADARHLKLTLANRRERQSSPAIRLLGPPLRRQRPPPKRSSPSVVRTSPTSRGRERSSARCREPRPARSRNFCCAGARSLVENSAKKKGGGSRPKSVYPRIMAMGRS
jgi:hypothetical protein